MTNKPVDEKRIEKMYRGDRLMAVIFVVALWLAYFFVYFQIDRYIQIPGVRYLLLTFGALVLLFNTSSVVSMIRHFAEDKHFIYDSDIRHLDEMKEKAGK